MTSAPELSADLGGFVVAGFEAVAEAFAQTVAADDGAGSAFAVVVDGETVVDLWGGLADRAGGRAWAQDTLCTVFSGTKGLVATCMLMLVERGALELDAPVSAYWPEFAAERKDGVRVHHVLTHTAGLPGVATPVTFEQLLDDELMARLLAAQAPASDPGEIVAYHALTYGWLCGELVRRVDGRSVGRFLREEVTKPLGLDAWIGLPEELEPRVAVLDKTAACGAGAALRPTDSPAAPDALARIRWSVLDNPPGLMSDLRAANDRRWRAAEIPGANGIVTARAMARLYACLARGGELDGVRLLSPALVAEAGRCRVRGYDPYRESPIAYGLGFHMREDGGALGPEPDAFGHGGAGGSIHGCWPRLQTGFSYAPSLLDERTEPRAAALAAALHDAVEGAA